MISTAAVGGDISSRSLEAAAPASWFAPASSARTQRGARPSLSGIFEASLSSGYGVGTVRLKSDPEPENPRVARLDTTWTTTVAEQPDTLRLGDSVNQSGIWGRSVRFGGLHYGTDLGSGLTSDAVTQMPRRAPALVPPESVDRAFAVGFLRSNYGLEGDRYGEPFASATVRFGVSADVTAEVRGSAQSGVSNGGIAFLARLDGLGLLTAAAASSTSEAGTGRLAQTGYEYRRGPFSAALTAAWASAEFRQLRLDDEGVPPRYWSAASATFDAARYGVFGIGYAAASADAGLAETLQGTYRLAVGPLSTLTVSLSQTFDAEPETSLMLTVTLPLDHVVRTPEARPGAGSSATIWAVDRLPPPTTASALPGAG